MLTEEGNSFFLCCVHHLSIHATFTNNCLLPKHSKAAEGFIVKHLIVVMLWRSYPKWIVHWGGGARWTALESQLQPVSLSESTNKFTISERMYICVQLPHTGKRMPNFPTNFPLIVACFWKKWKHITADYSCPFVLRQTKLTFCFSSPNHLINVAVWKPGWLSFFWLAHVPLSFSHHEHEAGCS